VTTLLIIVLLVNTQGGGAHSSTTTQQFKTQEACFMAINKIEISEQSAGKLNSGSYKILTACFPS